MRIYTKVQAYGMVRGLCVLQHKTAERPGMLHQHFCEYPRETVNGAVFCSGK